MNYPHSPLSFVTPIASLDALEFPAEQIKNKGYNQSASLEFVPPGNYMLAATAGGYTFPVRETWAASYSNWLKIKFSELRTVAVIGVTNMGVMAKKVEDVLE